MPCLGRGFVFAVLTLAAAGAAQVIPVALTSGAVTGVQVEVDDGLSLALALLNQTVTLVIVTVPFIALSEEAFDQAGKQLGILEFPWLVTRNFTVSSPAAAGSLDWPEVDLMYTRHKVGGVGGAGGLGGGGGGVWAAPMQGQGHVTRKFDRSGESYRLRRWHGGRSVRGLGGPRGKLATRKYACTHHRTACNGTSDNCSRPWPAPSPACSCA